MAGTSSFFWLLIIAHFIGDFYLQSESIAWRKKDKLNALLVHSALYAMPMLVVMTPYAGLKWCAIAFAVITVSHAGIDFIKIKVCHKLKNHEVITFFIDQLLHIVIIYIIASIYAIHNLIALNAFGALLLAVFNTLSTGIQAGTLIKSICAFLLILKPANIIIRTLKPRITTVKKVRINKYAPLHPSEKGSKRSDSKLESINAGRTIGNLERILVLLLLMFDQYTAIAFILTAKSITRYNKIVEDPSFAEYYLIGTLSSVLIAVLASLIAK